MKPITVHDDVIGVINQILDKLEMLDKKEEFTFEPENKVASDFAEEVKEEPVKFEEPKVEEPVEIGIPAGEGAENEPKKEEDVVVVGPSEEPKVEEVKAEEPVVEEKK